MPEYDQKKPKVDEEIAKLLKTLRDRFDMEDRSTREWQIRRYKKLKLYWNNMSQVFWSDSAQDYRIAASTALNADDDQAYYDRPINIFGGLLETIIAALSITIPGIACVPDDAENPLDVSTSKSGDKVYQLLARRINFVWLWLKALYVYSTEGMVACYHYPHKDKSYGEYDKKIYKPTEVEDYFCPECHSKLPEELFTQPDVGFADTQMSAPAQDQIQPQPEELGGLENPEDEMMNVLTCPNCDALLDPNMEKVKDVVEQFSHTEKQCKSSMCMEILGGLYVKVPNYAQDQKDFPYLAYDYETNYVNVLERYPHLREKIAKGTNQNAGLSSRDPYEQSGRLNPQYLGKFPDNNVTVGNRWFRPCSFYMHNEEDCKKLQRLFPDGVCVVFVDDVCAEYYKENLDDRWTVTKNPLSDYATFEPLGERLVNIQDLINDLISITIQTCEHGITQTWVDPSLVDAEGQKQIEATPGAITVTKAVPGRNISDGFFATQPATLAPEIFNFYRILMELGQFVSAAMPSIFGGAQTGKTSGTASEYAMSKTMALQRLQTPWRMFGIWWKDTFKKVIPQFLESMVDDEKFVKKQNDKWTNVIIKKAETGGTIGDVDLESSEHIPVTDDQKREFILELFKLNNMEIMEAFIAPENIESVRKVTKLVDFKLPGEDDRQKQRDEIEQLLDSKPIPSTIDPITGMPVEEPSVPVDPDIDNSEIEGAVCRAWLVSEIGRQTKLDNPDGYANVLLHYKAHLQIVQQNMMAQQAMAAAQQNQNGKPGGDTNKPPDNNQIKEQGDVQTPIH